MSTRGRIGPIVHFSVRLPIIAGPDLGREGAPGRMVSGVAWRCDTKEKEKENANSSLLQLQPEH